MEDEFVSIEDVVGPYIEYHVDPHDRIKSPLSVGKVVVLSESTGIWAINEETKAKK